MGGTKPFNEERRIYEKADEDKKKSEDRIKKALEYLGVEHGVLLIRAKHKYRLSDGEYSELLHQWKLTAVQHL